MCDGTSQTTRPYSRRILPFERSGRCRKNVFGIPIESQRRRRGFDVMLRRCRSLPLQTRSRMLNGTSLITSRFALSVNAGEMR